MKVCKFGGSSVADAAQINKVLKIVLDDPQRRIVVVSALGKRDKNDVKVTDLLISIAEKALAGEDAGATIDAVAARYGDIAAGLGIGDDVAAAVRKELQSRAAADKSSPGVFTDALKAAGEDLCARLVAAAFAARGVKARYASPLDTGMMLSGEPGAAVLVPESYKRLARSFSDFEGIVVYPGFFGHRADGSIATFPRGGSDITGSILAAAVRADVYENFTDVDSVYAVDPRVVPEVAAEIRTITYREMRELSYAGFGVFSDEAVYPAVKARIPINIRNTNRPELPGTMIQQSRRVEPGHPIGIACDTGFCNIIVEKYLMNREVGFGRRLFQILESEGVSYEHSPSGIDSISVIVRARGMDNIKEKRIVARIKRELAADDVVVTHGYAILMVVGEGMLNYPGILARAAQALADAGINITMVNQGASQVSFMIGISADRKDDAIRALYAAYFKEGR